MDDAINKSQKRLALQEVMKGNPEPLKQLRAHQGRPYSADELEQRRQFVSKLLGRPAALDETIRMLGGYDTSAIAGKVCIKFTTTIRAWLN